MPNQYDFIIAGMGCAGLSMAVQLKRSGHSFKKILIIDKEIKNKNDRTWCFWTQEKNNWFEDIIFKRWNYFEFKSSNYKNKFDLNPYSYCMIRGLDFYEQCLNELKQDERFELITDEIETIFTENISAVLKTKTNSYSANYIFNSAFRKQTILPTHTNLVQHFKGWLVETKENTFNELCPVFMDFTVPQHNDCRFVYVLPYSKTKALIEYTGFSEQAIPNSEYDTELSNYLKTNFKLSDYSILEIEQGEIPMMESRFINPFGNRVINIGTAGNASKASSGYTFYFIQKQVAAIILQLKKENQLINPPSKEKRFIYYDNVLLNVISKKKIAPSIIFETLFRKNNIKNILAFLNEESAFGQELGIINSLPKKEFMRAGLKKWFNISDTQLG